ncbi:unnamed protein product [Larinioides sclopetarius]|uniref:Uncharacterized protein n=1 Tax=Larinioides sclopetarius TaxID=280406 RepID=A0AAV2BSV1_9ARAC
MSIPVDLSWNFIGPEFRIPDLGKPNPATAYLDSSLRNFPFGRQNGTLLSLLILHRRRLRLRDVPTPFAIYFNDGVDVDITYVTCETSTETSYSYLSELQLLQPDV